MIGGISFPAETAPGARWGQAALIMLWVLVFDLTIGVSHNLDPSHSKADNLAACVLYRW